MMTHPFEATCESCAGTQLLTTKPEIAMIEDNGSFVCDSCAAKGIKAKPPPKGRAPRRTLDPSTGKLVPVKRRAAPRVELDDEDLSKRLRHLLLSDGCCLKDESPPSYFRPCPGCPRGLK